MLSRDFLRNVPLPEDLTLDDCYNAMKATQDFFTLIRTEANINLSSIIQANNFSGIVSNVFTQKLNDNSCYKCFSDQRYPDLIHERKRIGLEVKASNKPLKGGEGHNGHSGWHIIVCYKLLQNGDIEFTQVEIADLIGYEYENSDWKYQGSQRNSNNSQRTETYITTNIGTAKLRDGSLYLNPHEVHLSKSLLSTRLAISDILPVPKFSPFFKN